jgi:EmrB/QacA subfamily drug resistance transporter
MESTPATTREDTSETASNGSAARIATPSPHRAASAADRVSTATTGRSAPAPGPQPPVSRGWGIPLAVLVAGMFMSILDISIVNVAMASMSKDFGTSTEDMQWISTAYSLAEGVVVPASAWLGARFGLKRLYIWSLVLFTIGSALCGMAGGLESLIGFRVLQAIPGGVIPVTCLTILYRIVPKTQIGAAMGVYGVGIAVAPALGPALGGYLVEHFSWRTIFFINLPVGILGAIAGIFVLANFPAERNKPFDLPGFLCIAGALVSLLLAIEEGHDWGWTSYPVVMLFLVAIILLALFVVIELAVEHPLLDLRMFKTRTFDISLLLIVAIMVGMFAVTLYVPLFLQNIQGLSALNAGLDLLPQAVVMALTMSVGGQLYDRFGARLPAIIGLLLVGSGLTLLSQITPDIPRSTLILGMCVMSAGVGLGMIPVMTSGVSSLPGEFSDMGSAVNTLVQRMSSSIGIALFTVMSTHDRDQLLVDRSGLMAGSGTNANSSIVEYGQKGQIELNQLWQQVQANVQAHAYGSVFTIAAIIAFAGAALAFLMPSGRPAGGSGNVAIH